MGGRGGDGGRTGGVGSPVSCKILVAENHRKRRGFQGGKSGGGGGGGYRQTVIGQREIL